MKYYIDPPSGSYYGFPKVWDEKLDGDITEWMIREGYPKEQITLYGSQFHMRMWKHESEN